MVNWYYGYSRGTFVVIWNLGSIPDGVGIKGSNDDIGQFGHFGGLYINRVLFPIPSYEAV